MLRLLSSDRLDEKTKRQVQTGAQRRLQTVHHELLREHLQRSEHSEQRKEHQRAIVSISNLEFISTTMIGGNLWRS